jgi:hypothetical protein
MNINEWQDALLYHACWGRAEEVFSLVTVDDFDPGERQHLADLIQRGMLEGTLEAPWVKDEAQRLGKPSVNYVVSVISAGFTGTVPYYASRLRDESTRRHAEKALTQGIQNLRSRENDPFVIVEDVRRQLDALPMPAETDDDTWTLSDIMALEPKPSNFTLPGMLQHNERLVLTGTEGGGKSVFVYQLLTGAAFGVDSLTLEKHEPKRVLFLDVENNEFQARANLEKIVPVLREMTDVEPQWRSMKRRVVNLLATKDRADVIRRIVHYSPDILYMGTAYKLTDIADEQHRSVRAIQGVVDRIRQEISCSIVIEHHAGHGFQNDRNKMRPEGSSYWLRWPDFGYGMIPLKTDNNRRLMKLAPWRGDRATGRLYPVAVREGNVLPWDPIYQDEWDALYATKYDN